MVLCADCFYFNIFVRPMNHLDGCYARSFMGTPTTAPTTAPTTTAPTTAPTPLTTAPTPLTTAPTTAPTIGDQVTKFAGFRKSNSGSQNREHPPKWLVFLWFPLKYPQKGGPISFLSHELSPTGAEVAAIGGALGPI